MTTYTANLGLALPVTGDLTGTWGQTVNDAITTLLDSAVAGTTTLSTDADVTLTDTTGATNQARQAVILWTATGTLTRNITAPARTKVYVVINSTGGTQSIVLRGAGPTTGVTVVAGERCVVAWNGSDFAKVASTLPLSTITVAQGGTGATTLTANNVILGNGASPVQFVAPGTNGNILTSNGTTWTSATPSATGVTTITFGTTGLTPATATSGAVSVAGTLVAANGGTGQSSYAVGDLLFASTTTALSKLADVATGNALISGGVGVAPSYGKIGLTTHVSGTLPVSNGGTGATTLTANNVILGNGTSAPLFVAPGASGNVLTSNGTTWTSAAAGASLLGDTDSATPFETSLGFEAGNSTTGVNNTFIGYQAGKANTSGQDNAALGYQALDANTTGVYNTALGSEALGANTTGSRNTAVGRAALTSSTGDYNTATGNEALFSNTTGNYNTAVGNEALRTNTFGSNNAAVGHQALYANTTGSQNVAFGYQALDSNTTGNDNTAFGAGSLAANTIGTNNVAVGRRALEANTTGVDNVAVGATALDANTTGYSNTAVGFTALGANTTGYENTALGRALAANTTGYSNTAVGYLALSVNSTGIENVAVGRSALSQATTGNNNAAVGCFAGSAITTGTQNTLLGANAGNSGTNNLTTGSNNTIIGYNAASSSATVSNEITLGNSSIATIRAQVTTITALSDARDKRNVRPLPAGLDFVNALRPVAFEWAMRDGGKVGVPDTGFIAQDLQEVQEATETEIPGLVYASNPDKLEAGYGKLLPVLVKAIQDLSAQVQSLQAQVAQLQGAK
jgi:hypothetical protein